MTIQNDLQKALAAAKSTTGQYLNFALSTQDENVKQMFNEMASDLERHAAQINGRLKYLEQNNSLNQPQT